MPRRLNLGSCNLGGETDCFILTLAHILLKSPTDS